uniref:Uncharacterized protein n=1 Tax=Rhizophora mucronata TaxID=61149 RepID=A0A2P2NRV8_RHIMU
MKIVSYLSGLHTLVCIVVGSNCLGIEVCFYLAQFVCYHVCCTSKHY